MSDAEQFKRKAFEAASRDLALVSFGIYAGMKMAKQRQPSIDAAVQRMRAWQRHWLLRQYGEDGRVLPENLELSECLDVVLESASKESEQRKAKMASHLRWVADRLVNVYGESPNVDFVIRLREIASEIESP